MASNLSLPDWAEALGSGLRGVPDRITDHVHVLKVSVARLLPHAGDAQSTRLDQSLIPIHVKNDPGK